MAAMLSLTTDIWDLGYLSGWSFFKATMTIMSKANSFIIA